MEIKHRIYYVQYWLVVLAFLRRKQSLVLNMSGIREVALDCQGRHVSFIEKGKQKQTSCSNERGEKTGSWQEAFLFSYLIYYWRKKQTLEFGSQDPWILWRRHYGGIVTLTLHCLDRQCQSIALIMNSCSSQSWFEMFPDRSDNRYFEPVSGKTGVEVAVCVKGCKLRFQKQGAVFFPSRCR